jgi:hypothetical protein
MPVPLASATCPLVPNPGLTPLPCCWSRFAGASASVLPHRLILWESHRSRFIALAEGVAAKPPSAVTRSSTGSILPTASTALIVSSSGMGFS